MSKKEKTIKSLKKKLKKLKAELAKLKSAVGGRPKRKIAAKKKSKKKAAAPAAAKTGKPQAIAKDSTQPAVRVVTAR